MQDLETNTMLPMEKYEAAHEASQLILDMCQLHDPDKIIYSMFDIELVAQSCYPSLVDMVKLFDSCFLENDHVELTTLYERVQYFQICHSILEEQHFSAVG